MNRIHPTAYIGPDVELGDGNVVGPYAVVFGPTRIGDGNDISSHVVIGSPGESRGGPHPVGWDGEQTGGGVQIGDRNVIREFVTVQAGDVPTVIGSDCYLMTKSHVPHDARLEDGVTLSSGALIGGHSQIGAHANVGLNAVIHQRLVIGPGAMVGMGSVVTKDVPPFATAFGSPARVRGANRVGADRRGLPREAVSWLEDAYQSRDASSLEAEPPGSLADDFGWFRRAAELTGRG